MAKMLMGAFGSTAEADQAISELEQTGYTSRDMSIISNSDHYDGHESHSKGANIASGAAAGATTGGAIGGLAGLVAGIGIVPALAGLFIGGPIAAAIGLTGAAAATVSGAITGAAAGGLIGALTKLGLSHDTAESYDRAVRSGGVVIGLTTTDDMTAAARDIFENHGATDVSLIDAPTDMATSTTTEYTDEPATRMGAAEPAFGEYRSPTEVEDDLV